MITRRGMAGVLLAGALLVLSGCEQPQDRAELRYRLTVEVDTPQGVVSGHSVIKVTASLVPKWLHLNPDASRISKGHVGEAVAVDLPGGQTLFALLRSESGNVDAPTYWPVWAFADQVKEANGTNANFLDAVRFLGGLGNSGLVRPLPKTEYTLANGGQDIPASPMLVTFKDINDPMSVQRVNPEDLSASFGKGYKLKAITVQVTDEAVTTGIQKRLGWWENFQDKQLDGHRYNDSTEFSNSLNRSSFSQGVKK